LDLTGTKEIMKTIYVAIMAVCIAIFITTKITRDPATRQNAAGNTKLHDRLHDERGSAIV
jgi:hypothetical protein